MNILRFCLLLVLGLAGHAAQPPASAPQPPTAPTAPGAAAAKEPKADHPKAPELAGTFQLTGERWTYREGDFAMSGILLKPEGKGPFAGLLLSHGRGGNAVGFAESKAQEMVKWGVVCIAPDYAHAGAATDRTKFGASDENIRRARTCLAILRSLPEVDGKRLAAYGHSMGGFVTIGLAGAVPEQLKAVAITGSGISPRSGFAAPGPETAEKVRTPFLIMHGGSDNTVRPQQSADLKEILDRNHVPNERHLFDGEDHPIDQRKRAEVLGFLHEWLRKYGVLPAEK